MSGNPHTTEAGMHSFVGMLRTYYLAAIDHGFDEQQAFYMMLQYQSEILMAMMENRQDDDGATTT